MIVQIKFEEQKAGGKPDYMGVTILVCIIQWFQK